MNATQQKLEARKRVSVTRDVNSKNTIMIIKIKIDLRCNEETTLRMENVTNFCKGDQLEMFTRNSTD